jgi:hypothetical protein
MEGIPVRLGLGAVEASLLSAPREISCCTYEAVLAGIKSTHTCGILTDILGPYSFARK